MNYGRTLGNQVLIKLDPENDRIRCRNGVELYIIPLEKDTTVTGIVGGLPSKLTYTGEANNGMPWLTDIEVEVGDEVIIYYMSVMNALSEQYQKYFIRNGERFIFIPYSSIFAKVKDDKPVPVNGYCLIKPIEDPLNIRITERLSAIGLVSVTKKTKSSTNVVWGRVAYLGTPNREYCGGDTEDGVDIKIGDTVVMKKVTDVLMQYELHQKIDDKKPYYRVQRRHIYAKL